MCEKGVIITPASQSGSKHKIVPDRVSPEPLEERRCQGNVTSFFIFSVKNRTKIVLDCYKNNR
jgi:hypothetical protein